MASTTPRRAHTLAQLLAYLISNGALSLLAALKTLDWSSAPATPALLLFLKAFFEHFLLAAYAAAGTATAGAASAAAGVALGPTPGAGAGRGGLPNAPFGGLVVAARSMDTARGGSGAARVDVLKSCAASLGGSPEAIALRDNLAVFFASHCDGPPPGLGGAGSGAEAADALVRYKAAAKRFKRCLRDAKELFTAAAARR